MRKLFFGDSGTEPYVSHHDKFWLSELFRG